MLISSVLTTLQATLRSASASPIPFVQGNHTLLERRLSSSLEPRDALTGVTLLKPTRPPGSNFCVDDADWSAAEGGRVQLWDCHAGLNQQWRLEKVRLDRDQFKPKSVTHFRVRRVGSDMCLHFVAPGSGDYFDISREYVLPLTLSHCANAARFTWQDASLCAFVGNGYDFYVKNGRDYGFCIAPDQPDREGMRNGDALVVNSDPAYRIRFQQLGADVSELAQGR